MVQSALCALACFDCRLFGERDSMRDFFILITMQFRFVFSFRCVQYNDDLRDRERVEKKLMFQKIQHSINSITIVV